MPPQNKDDESGKTVEFTPPSYALRAKAPLTDRDLDSVLSVADETLSAMTEDYEEWVRNDISRLLDAYEALKASGEEREQIEVIYAISHDMRGQGGSFGYELVTMVCESLCNLVMNRESLDQPVLDAVGVHLDCLQLIVSKPLKGDDGAQGQLIVAELEKVSSAVTE